MIKSFISTIGVIYIFLLMIMSHAVLMACIQAAKDPTSLSDELKPIASEIPRGCPQVSRKIRKDFISRN